MGKICTLYCFIQLTIDQTIAKTWKIFQNWKLKFNQHMTKSWLQMEIVSKNIVLVSLRIRGIRHSLMKGNPKDPLRFKRQTLLSVILNKIKTLAPIMMCISIQHYLLSLNRTVQDPIVFSLPIILHMTWTLMRKKIRLIILSSCFVNHMRQREKGPFHFLKASLLKMNNVFILEEPTNIQAYKMTYANP